jgi:hypothetical protein
LGVFHKELLFSTRFHGFPGLLSALALLLFPAPGLAANDNGFDLSVSSIPRREIHHGGPARDGIPALSQPKTQPAKGSAWDDSIMILGLSIGDETRAYPINILAHHELVNDVVGGKEILISYCPLCGTAMVFQRRLEGRLLDFGVSGLLYQSDLLMYDRQTESLWSQIKATAVTGSMLGTRLPLLRSEMMSWGRWQKLHPTTTILSRVTGHFRNYDHLPYGDYAQVRQVYFPVQLDPRYHPKLPTLGLRTPTGQARAYPSAEVLAAGGEVTEQFEGNEIQVAYDERSATFRVQAPAEIQIIEGYWFAWMAFHPKSSVYRAP